MLSLRRIRTISLSFGWICELTRQTRSVGERSGSMLEEEEISNLWLLTPDGGEEI